MAKKYKNQDLLKFLVVLGGIVGLIEAILVIVNFAGAEVPIVGRYVILGAAVNVVIIAIVCMVGAVLTLLCGLRPDDPIPFHIIIFLIFAIWLIVCGALIGGVLVLIAFLIGLIEELS